MRSLSVVIPAYNEDKRIGNTIKNIENYLQKKCFDYEIIVVDDGSTDKTKEILREVSNNVILLENIQNKGKGYSVKKGILFAKKEMILFSDADLSTPIEELEKLIKYLEEGYDVVIGSRRLPDSQIKIKQPWNRQLAGKCFFLLIRFIALKKIKDTQCGFKLFKAKVIKELCNKQKLAGFSFDVELLFLAQIAGYSIKEVPVIWIDSPQESKVRLLKHSFKMFQDVLKIRINKWTNKYEHSVFP